jgi:hypothetical protein
MYKTGLENVPYKKQNSYYFWFNETVRNQQFFASKWSSSHFADLETDPVPKPNSILGSVADRIRMFLGLLDPALDPLVRGTDPDRGSGFFYHQAKIVRNPEGIPTVLWLLYDFLSLKKWCNLPSKSVLKVNDENSRIWIRIH